VYRDMKLDNSNGKLGTGIITTLGYVRASGSRLAATLGSSAGTSSTSVAHALPTARRLSARATTPG
jgi:hypothetical protein